MNEAKAIAGEKQTFTFNGHEITFTPPSVRWATQFGVYLQTQMDNVRDGNATGAENVYEFIATTIDKDKDWLLDNIPMAKYPEFLETWLDLVGAEVLRNFFIAGRVGLITTISKGLKTDTQ